MSNTSIRHSRRWGACDGKLSRGTGETGLCKIGGCKPNPLVRNLITLRFFPASKLSVGKSPKVRSDLCVLRNRLASKCLGDVFYFFDSSLNLNVTNPDNPKSLKAEPQSKYFFLVFFFPLSFLARLLGSLLSSRPSLKFAERLFTGY